MSDKDGSNHQNNVGSPEKGEKSKGGKSKRKGKNRGQNAGPDPTSEPGQSTSVDCTTGKCCTGKEQVNVDVFKNKAFI